MANTNNGTSNGRYTINERIEYHLNQAKVGAKGRNGQPLSDFARGKHAQKAEALIKQKADYIKNNPGAISPENLQAHMASQQKRRDEQRAYHEGQAKKNGGARK